VVVVVIIIIIIIIQFYLGLDRKFHPCPTVSYNSFKLAFFYSVYNSELLFPSCCSSFLLQFVDNLICIFLVFGSWFYLQLFQSFLIPLWSKMVNPSFFWKTWSRLMSIVFYPLYKGPNFASVYSNGDKVTPISSIGTGLRYVMKKWSIERSLFVVYLRSDGGQPLQGDLWSLHQFLHGTSNRPLQSVMNERPNYLEI
jgi:hypothetical protein